MQSQVTKFKVENPIDSIITSDSKIECDHTYSLYQGLREVYQYCTKCDHKLEVVK